IMSALFFPLTMRVDHKRMKATQERLEEIKEALLGFAVLNDSLPCPALSAEDGKSPVPPPVPCGNEGYLPWADLGVGRYDAWGNPFRYRVGSQSPYTSSDLKVQDKQAIDLVNKDKDGNSRIIAIIFSCGKNGFPDPTPKTDLNLTNDADGNRNIKAICTNAGTKNNAVYIQDVYVEDKSDGINTFDDMLIWLPKSILINRLAEAGKWPPP
ncbi:hypothetical protein QUF54_07900, partial [Candidatus Marithioploca araucensis]|nr:hypothetical protein [Candidatus Marithioploca araucensis]